MTETEPTRYWTAPPSTLWQRLRNPGWSDAERAFPALRSASGVGEMDRSKADAAALSAPDGDWPEDILAMRTYVEVAVQVVLQDSTDPLNGHPVLSPHFTPRYANRIDCETPDGAAQWECDVEGEGPYRIRYCSVIWRTITRSKRDAFAKYFTAWRRAALSRLAAGPVPTEDLTPSIIDRGAFAWCLGPRDRMEITLERPDGQLAVSATRAWAKRREVCR
ncbi:MAG: hypothetical protein QNI90_05430 [Dinoroseobacter sp.]|nr:hypothetical protein [Dinoroseobacter sp.]